MCGISADLRTNATSTRSPKSESQRHEPTKRHGRMGRGIKRPPSTDDTMQAVVQNGYGSADVLQLEQVARPVIADDEVLMVRGWPRSRDLASDDRSAVPAPTRVRAA